MLATALSMSTPTALRFPKTLPNPLMARSRRARSPRSSTRRRFAVRTRRRQDGAGRLQSLDSWARSPQGHPLRCSGPAPRRPDDRRRARHERVVTVEDGTRHGGAGRSWSRHFAAAPGLAVPSLRHGSSVHRAPTRAAPTDKLLAELASIPRDSRPRSRDSSRPARVRAVLPLSPRPNYQ